MLKYTLRVRLEPSGAHEAVEGGHDCGLDVALALDANVLLQRHEGDACLGATICSARRPNSGGLILVRELDERLGLGELIDEHLSDSRQGTNKQFTLADLLRQSI